MEQATAGKAPPPPMALNSGGGGILLNMNAVRAAAGVGAVVPSSPNAQSAAVVGPPGPPGKALVGPRMISINPQMIASAAGARPGQHVEESESGVKLYNKLSTTSKHNCTTAMASVAAECVSVSSDLKGDGDDKVKKYLEDPRTVNRKRSHVNLVKSPDNHVEGNNMITDNGDENYINLSGPSNTAEKSVIETVISSSCQADIERSAVLFHNSASEPPTPPSRSSPQHCLSSQPSEDIDNPPSNENDNGALLMSSDNQDISMSDKIQVVSVVRNLDLGKASPSESSQQPKGASNDDGLVEVDNLNGQVFNCSNNVRVSNLSVINHVSKAVPSSCSGTFISAGSNSGAETETVITETKEDEDKTGCLESEKNTTSVIVTDAFTKSGIYETEYESSINVTNKSNSGNELGQTDTCNSYHSVPESPPLSLEDVRNDEAGNAADSHNSNNNGSYVNLDMFPESAPKSGNATAEVEDSSKSVTSSEEKRVNDNSTKEGAGQKIMDLNLADFILMDCNDNEENRSSQWAHSHSRSSSSISNVSNVKTPPTSTSTTPSLDENFGVPIHQKDEISNKEFCATDSSVGDIEALSISAGTSRSRNASSEQYPFASSSCAFQLHTIGQGQPPERSANVIQLPSNEIRTATQFPDCRSGSYQSNYRTEQQQQLPMSGYPNSISHSSNSIRSNGQTIPVQHERNSSYTSQTAQTLRPGTTDSISQQQQHQCFTADPQLHSQFLQFQQRFPLGQGQTNKDLPPSTPAVAAVVPPARIMPAQQQRQTSSVAYPNQQYQNSPGPSQNFQSSSITHIRPILDNNGNYSSRTFANAKVPLNSGQIPKMPTSTIQYVNNRETGNPYGFTPAGAAAVAATSSFRPTLSNLVPSRQNFPPAQHHQREFSSCSYPNNNNPPTAAIIPQVNQEILPEGYPSCSRLQQMYTYSGGIRIPSHSSVYPGSNRTSQAPFQQQKQLPIVPVQSSSHRPMNSYQNQTGAQNAPRVIQVAPIRHSHPVNVNAGHPQTSQPNFHYNSSININNPTSKSFQQNLIPRGGSGGDAGLLRPQQQPSYQYAPSRLPVPHASSSSESGARQNFLSSHSSQSYSTDKALHHAHRQHGMQQMRTTSVIGYGRSTNHSSGVPGVGVMPNSSNVPQSQSQMVRHQQNSCAQFNNASSYTSQHGALNTSTSVGGNQSVIRPNMYSGGSIITTNTNDANSSCSRQSVQSFAVAPSCGTTSNSSSSNLNINIRADIFGRSHSSGSNQAPNSRLTNSSGGLEAGSVSSNFAYSRGVGHQPSTSTSTGSGYSNELTLQSFLSHPTAPFMCPPTVTSSVSPSQSPTFPSSSSAERSSSSSASSSGSAYYSKNVSWERGSASARGDSGLEEDHSQLPMSSCQYSDAMRRFNAPITLQALSGLPPGANHLLVKTENGQFQLVSVRMQSPTAAAAAPGTPVVPSTVAAPHTSMSIAQQLPSNSSLAPPPVPHSAPTGPPLVPPLPSSIITTSTIPPLPTQQGRIITSSSSNHIATSWSSSNNTNSLVNNKSTPSPLPMISSTAAPGPPPLPSPSSHPSPLPLPPIPSSVIMPPPTLSTSNSQLLVSTANNISSSSSSTIFSSAMEAVVASAQAAYQQRAVNPMSLSGGPPRPGAAPLSHLPNSIPSGTSTVPPPGPSVIRTSGLAGSGSLPPPPPIVVTTAANSPGGAPVISSSSVGSSPASNLPSAPSSTRTQPNTTSQVPNNNATNNAGGSLGMMMTASTPNSIMSVHPHHQFHPAYPPLHQPSPLLAQQESSYPSNAAAANTVSQMSNETAKNKCKNFLSFLLELSAKQNATVARNVKGLIQGLIDGKVNEENFADRLQKEVNSQPQPCLVGFLKKSLPHLRHSLATNELKIDGIKPPVPSFTPPTGSSSVVPPPAPVERKQTQPVRPTTPTVPTPTPTRIHTPPVHSASPSSTPPNSVLPSSVSGTPAASAPTPTSTKSSKSSKGGSSKSKSNAASNHLSTAGSTSSATGGAASSKSSIPASKASKEKEKKDKAFSSSGYSADDDINDVAAMGGVNLAEESQRILGSTEYVGTQIRSCRDETLISASPIISKFKVIATKYGLEETPSSDVSALLSHAVEERLKTMIEKLSVIAEHRMDVIKLDDRYEITQDVKGQLRFLEELDKLEKKRHDEQEREMLIRAAKSRSKSEDPEQAKLKAKAKEMQRVALEEMRQRDANFTALQAIGPRKKPKLDPNGGSHGSAVSSPLGATGASSSLGRPQMPLRPRLKRVNLRDLLFLLEHDKETMRSPFLYKNLLLKQ